MYHEWFHWLHHLQKQMPNVIKKNYHSESRKQVVLLQRLIDVWCCRTRTGRGHDCPNWRMRCSCACHRVVFLSECMRGAVATNAKILPVMRATREILWDLCHVSTKWQYVTIMTSTTIVQFFVSTTQLESLQGSCSLIILKLLTSEKRFVGKKWKANGWLKGPGVCHHNAAGWSSPETWDQQKWKVEFFSLNIHFFKNKMMHETVLPDALDADMGKLPSRKSKIRSAICLLPQSLWSLLTGKKSRILRWLSHHGAEKMSRLENFPTKKMSHGNLIYYGFTS